MALSVVHLNYQKCKRPDSVLSNPCPTHFCLPTASGKERKEGEFGKAEIEVGRRQQGAGAAGRQRYKIILRGRGGEVPSEERKFLVGGGRGGRES